MDSKTEERSLCMGFPALFQPRYLDRLRALPGLSVDCLPIDGGASWAEVNASVPHVEPPPWGTGVARERREVLARAEALVTLNVPEDLPSLAPRLRWIQACGAGVEQFAKAGVQRERVLLTNVSGVSATSISEWVVGRLLQVWKRLGEADEHQRNRVFERTYGRTFAGSTIGIVGLGHIGKAVAQRVRALGCRVLASRRSAAPGAVSEYAETLYPASALHEMLAQCDAVVIAAPATPATKHLFDARALAAMREDAVLVNVARGSLVDEAALAAALARGELAAAVLDVFEQEPLPPESPLWGLPGVYISAHSSVSLDRYMDDVFEIVLENTQRWLAGEALRNAVDMEALGFA